MNRHFSIIYRKSVISGAILLLVSIVLFSVPISFLLTGGSKLWLIAIIIAVGLFLIGIVSMGSILSAGIDVKDNMVIFPGMDLAKGKSPQFSLGNLQDILLRNGDGKELDPYKDDLFGARFVFILKDGSEKIYYPVALTAKQFEKVKNGMLGEK